MKVKVLKKILSFATSLTILGNLPMLNASAGVDQIYVCELKKDLSSCKAYYSHDYALNYGEYTIRGARMWMSDDLYFTLDWNRGYSMGNAAAICYEVDDPDEDLLAYTLKFSDTIAGVINGDEHDWSYCTVNINKNNDVPLSTYAHEFGHVMGLKDNNNNQNSIMCQVGSGRIAESPSDYDLFVLSAKYYERD